ncbi:MAG: ABC transporter ATP-binding protein [Methanomassiliicoccales archaeon]|nr:ABC transporter ATP-binding protein [Methanomassiliicoccales archaeon]
MSSLLVVENVRKYYRLGLLGKKIVKAVENASLDIDYGETLGLMGPSGCGKSTLARVILRILRPDEGKILFKGEDITSLKMRRLRRLRGEMTLVSQSPETSLNPRFTVYQSIAEPLLLYSRNRPGIREKVLELMNKVGLNAELLDRYPFQLSGGQMQRIAIARAIALNPKLVVLDEPTSMLDPLMQAQILHLLRRIQEEMGTSYLFISHDPEVVQWISDRIVRMKEGKTYHDAS